MITWEISFDFIQQVRPSAADLLSLMSFFDRQGIPEILLRTIPENISIREDITNTQDASDDTISESSASEEFENDIIVLRNFSFISVEADGSTFQIHRLVQLATQRWLGIHKQLEKWKQLSIQTLYKCFPSVKYENWETCQILLPHAKLVATQKPDEETFLKWASILNSVAGYSRQMGNFTAALMLGLKSVEAKKAKLGPEHPSVLTTLGFLGGTYAKAGLWDEAEKLREEIFDISKRVLGSEHPNTLSSMNNLASIYDRNGRWDQAQELGLQVVDIRTRILGPEHPDTLTSMNTLASTYQQKGQWDHAQELSLQVVNNRKRILGPEHPDTLNSMCNLARLYRKTGQMEQAKELALQTFETSKRILGPKHPRTLNSMHNLASIWKLQGRDTEAIELMVDCVRFRKQVLGASHPYLVASSKSLEKWQTRIVSSTLASQAPRLICHTLNLVSCRNLQ